MFCLSTGLGLGGVSIRNEGTLKLSDDHVTLLVKSHGRAARAFSGTFVSPRIQLEQVIHNRSPTSSVSRSFFYPPRTVLFKSSQYLDAGDYAAAERLFTAALRFWDDLGDTARLVSTVPDVGYTLFAWMGNLVRHFRLE